jgi:cephalosporin-C deacetylase-like acetyl esterase
MKRNVKYPLKDARIICSTNKEALSYKKGEEMVFTFKFESSDTPAEGLFFEYKRFGDDDVTFTGKAPATEPLVIKTSIDKPGFVCVTVYLKNARGTQMRFANSYHKQPIAFFAGAGVEPEYHTDCGEPADFDGFWAKQKQRLPEVPFKDQCELVKLGVFKKVTIYRISIPAPGPRPVTGFLGIPVGAEPGSLPAHASFIGYGFRIQRRPYFEADRISLQINAHGQEIGRDAAYYKEFFNSINTNGVGYGFDPELNKSPETAFFNQMVMRVLRALEYLKSRPEWDGRNLVVNGGSQGALQAVTVAAHSKDVTEVVAYKPWFCDLKSSEEGYMKGWRPDFAEGLGYFDSASFAKRITCKVSISAGLGDPLCPPAGVAAMYNALNCPKSLTFGQNQTHSYRPPYGDKFTFSAE